MSYDVKDYILEKELQKVGGCMIALGTVSMGIRLAIRAIKRRFSLADEMVIAAGWACMVTVCAAYIFVTPAIYRTSAAARGELKLYPTLPQDALLLRKILFASAMLFWTCLWCIKVSLLIQCRRLVSRQRTYIIIWWGIMGFVAMSFIGCIITELTACGNISNRWKQTGCLAAEDIRRAAIGLYYAYAVDVASNLMIIIFPIPVLINLKLDRPRKLGIIGIFGVAAICICVASLRVARVGDSSAHSTQPSPSWLALWTMVESSIAVLIGCLPTLGLLFPAVKTAPYGRYDSEATKSGYTNKSFTRVSESESTVGDEYIPMSTYPPTTFSRKRSTLDSQSHDFSISANMSNERINWCAPGVMVTKTFAVDEPGSPTKLPPATLPPAKHARDVI